MLSSHVRITEFVILTCEDNYEVPNQRANTTLSGVRVRTVAARESILVDFTNQNASSARIEYSLQVFRGNTSIRNIPRSNRLLGTAANNNFYQLHPTDLTGWTEALLRVDVGSVGTSSRLTPP